VFILFFIPCPSRQISLYPCQQ